jgi:hypothetical protein
MRVADLMERVLGGVEGVECLNLWSTQDLRWEKAVHLHFDCRQAPVPADLAAAVTTHLANSPFVVMEKVERRFTPVYGKPGSVDTVIDITLGLPSIHTRPAFPEKVVVSLDETGAPPACEIIVVEEEVPEELVPAHTRVAATVVRCTDPLTGEVKEEKVTQ